MISEIIISDYEVFNFSERLEMAKSAKSTVTWRVIGCHGGKSSDQDCSLLFPLPSPLQSIRCRSPTATMSTAR